MSRSTLSDEETARREVIALRADIQALPDRIASAVVEKLDKELRHVWVTIVIFVILWWLYRTFL